MATPETSAPLGGLLPKAAPKGRFAERLNFPQLQRTAGQEFQASLNRLTGGVVLIGWVAAVLYATQFPLQKSLSVLGAAAGVGAAAAAAGCLVGFLFGIPRSLQADQQSQDRQSNGYANNTNLEQISDWLTKILVGIGLVQIASAPDALGHLATRLAPAFGDTTTSAAFALTLALYFSVSGLLIAYLWTRARLKSILVTTDQELVEALATRKAEQVASEKAAEVAELVAADRSKEIQSLAANRAHEVATSVAGDIAAEAVHAGALATADHNALAQVLVDRQLSGSSPPTLVELVEAVSQSTPDWRVTFYHRAEEIRSANWSNQDHSKMDRVIPVFRALVENDRERRFFRHFASLGYALKDKEPPDYAEALELLTIAIQLRDAHGKSGSPYFEWNRALCRIKLDQAFAAHLPSPEAERNLIMSDLVAAARLLDDHYFELGKNPEWSTVGEWLRLQGLDVADLRA